MKCNNNNGKDKQHYIYTHMYLLFHYISDLMNNVNGRMQGSSCDISFLKECSYKDELLTELYNDWTEIENKNECTIYPTRIRRRLKYFEVSYDEPNLEDYEPDLNEPKYIDNYLFEDVPESSDTSSIVESPKKTVNVELSTCEDENFDCCSIFSIDESFCTCGYANINKENNLNTDNAFQEEHKNECLKQTNINDQDLKEISSSSETSSCQSEIASPIYEIISSSNPKKDFYLDLKNNSKLETTSHVRYWFIFTFLNACK